MGLGTGARTRLTARPLPTLLQPLELQSLESLAAVAEGAARDPGRGGESAPAVQEIVGSVGRSQNRYSGQDVLTFPEELAD